MKKYKLRLRYVYTFYSFDELLASDIRDETVEIGDGCRFTLYQQEDSSFTVSAPRQDTAGSFVILTYPNKDNLIIREGEETELVYDEFYDAMGDSNHNVYEGTAVLITE